MKNVLNSPETGWEALKNGTYANEYSNVARTALQKAIDKHSVNIPIERKKDTEEGDLQMNDGSGWEQFCIHKAQNLISTDGKYIALREFINGQWINYKKERNDIFFNLMLEKKKSTGVSNRKITEHVCLESKMTNEQWHKMIEQDRQEARYEGNYGSRRYR